MTPASVMGLLKSFFSISDSLNAPKPLYITLYQDYRIFDPLQTRTIVAPKA